MRNIECESICQNTLKRSKLSHGKGTQLVANDSGSKADRANKNVRMSKAKRSRMWHKAILALMNCSSIPAAAKAIGVHENTLEHWLHDEEFGDLLLKAQQEAVGLGTIKLVLRITESIDGLHAIAMDPEVHPSIRSNAFVKEIELATRAIVAQSTADEIKRLTDKINALEQNKASGISEGDKAIDHRKAVRSGSGRQPLALLSNNGEEADEGGDSES